MEHIVRALIHYCKYQERCHYEVKEKLASLGCYGDDAAEIIAQLIEADLLNETRFAKAFAGGKFRMLKWGRTKIISELKRKQISPYNLKQALTEIPEDEYQNVLHHLAARKWHELKGVKSKLEKKKKLMNYLIQKGYEQTLIYDWLNTAFSGNENS
ncbi:MAG: hypothetical protein EBZ77_07925 [Chitinophagia bacterium]|nr:hypothetical protein [Chitinophagia bacterium]